MEQENNYYFNFFLVGLITGIGLLGRMGDVHLSIFLFIFLVLILTPYVYYYKFHRKIVIIFLLACFTGGVNTYYSIKGVNENSLQIEPYIGAYVHQKGEVYELYRRSDYYDEYVLNLIDIADKNVGTNIKYLLRVPKNFHLDIGQIIVYSGKVYPLENFNGFAYNKFMLSKGIYFSSSANNFDTIINPKVGWKYKLSSSRSLLLNKISSIFPERESIFLGGILFGARENIPKDLKEDFNNSGLTHFIAVSGFNITLCIIFVTLIFGFLPMYFRIVIVCVTITLFSLFVGLGAPVVRASIMGLIGYVFLQSGTNAKNITLILFTALCMGLYSPLSLIYDVSLHLSFLAVIGIIYTQDIFKKIFYWVPSAFAIREAFVLTLAALSFSLPIMIFQFGQVSLLAPIANIAVTWTIPLAMIGGAATLLLDVIHPFLGKLLGFPTWILLHYDMLMVSYFGNKEFALIRFDFGAYKNYLQALYFVVLIYFLTLYHIRNKKQP